MGAIAQPCEREQGFALMVGLVIVLVMTAFSSALVYVSAAHHVSTKTATERARALALGEGAVTLLLNDLERDPLTPVRDELGYKLLDKSFVREYAPFDPEDGTVRVSLTYLVRDEGKLVPVTFDSRATPEKPYDRVHVTVAAFRPGVRRIIDLELERLFVLFDGAVVSDAVPTGPGADGDKSRKAEAMNGHIVFDDRGRGGQFYVNGSLMANGGVYHEGVELTTENANDHILFAGGIVTDLAGTEDQLPDYTSIGSSNQLFDFDRFVAAARAGAGREFTSVPAFIAAMRAANDAGDPLEGITVLSIDDSVNSIENGDLTRGINILGTLVVRFATGTDPMFKLFIRCECNINAADTSGLVPSDVSTYKTGYDVPWSNEGLRPHNVDISGAGFENFRESDDYPALMFNTGIVDLHDAANISGLIYGPSFIEIENKGARLQFFNGGVFGGGGVYFEGNGTSGVTVVSFDPNTIDQLATQDAKGQGLRLLNWRVRG
jgi:hypothetical protein